MKKAKKLKFLSLILLMSMLSCVILSSCGSSASDYTDAYYRPGVTLVIYTIADNVTPEAKAEVEEKINNITKNKYSTKIVLKYLSKSEYKSVLDSKWAAYDEEVARLEEESSIKASIEKSSRAQYNADKAAGKITTEGKTRRPTDAP